MYRLLHGRNYRDARDVALAAIGRVAGDNTLDSREAMLRTVYFHYVVATCSVNLQDTELAASVYVSVECNLFPWCMVYYRVPGLTVWMMCLGGLKITSPPL